MSKFLIIGFIVGVVGYLIIFAFNGVGFDTINEAIMYLGFNSTISGLLGSFVGYFRYKTQ